MFYVYLLHSAKDNGFYIGYSTDLKRRLLGHPRGASFATKSRGPWKLIYYEAYTEREDAEGREKLRADLFTLCTERHSNSNLARALRDRVTQDAVGSDRRQKQRDAGENSCE